MSFPINSSLASLIFIPRGIDKTIGDSHTQGNRARIIPTIGQCWNGVKSIASNFGKGGAYSLFKEQGTFLGNAANNFVEAAKATATNKTIAGGLFNCVNFIGKHVNSFIGLACLWNVYKAEEGEKTRTAIGEGTGFGAMLLAEDFTKRQIGSSYGNSSAANKVKSFLYKGKTGDSKVKLTGLIVDSLIFAGVSIGSWLTASTATKKIYDDVTGRTSENAKLAEIAKRLETQELPLKKADTEVQEGETAPEKKEIPMQEMLAMEQEKINEKKRELQEKTKQTNAELQQKIAKLRKEDLQMRYESLS